MKELKWILYVVLTLAVGGLALFLPPPQSIEEASRSLTFLMAAIVTIALPPIFFNLGEAEEKVNLGNKTYTGWWKPLLPMLAFIAVEGLVIYLSH